MKMKIEKINENKIRVTISLSDLEERNIDLGSLNYNSPAAQELFWDMMEQAEMQFGFDTADSQLCIEAMPDSDEGFIVTITKLDDDGDFESIQKYIKNKFTKKELRNKKKSRKLYSALVVYSFDNFEDLCLLSKKIQPVYTGDSTLYKLKSVYYLVMTRNTLCLSNPKVFDTILCEYGTKVTNSALYEGYLSEYATKMVEYNALEVLNSYF